MDGLNEGIASTLVKAGLKVASKAGKKAIQKSGESIAKKTGSKIAGKATEKAMEKTASKIASKITPKVATRMFKQVAEKMNKSKIIKMISNKRYVRTLIASNFLDEHTDDFKTTFELLTDYIKGNYKSTPWTIIALLGASAAYVLLPEEFGKKIDESQELDDVLTKTLTYCKSELDKYKEWKLKHPQEASLLDKDDSIISEFGDSPVLLQKDLVNESIISDIEHHLYINITQNLSRYLIFESAETDEKKIEELRKVDEDTANKVTQALKSNGATPLQLNEKGAKFLQQGQQQGTNVDSFKGKKKPDKEAAKKVLEQEGWFMKTMKEIFSKETLVSLIPFSQKPTLADFGQFFLCMKDYVAR